MNKIIIIFACLITHQTYAMQEVKQIHAHTQEATQCAQLPMGLLRLITAYALNPFDYLSTLGERIEINAHDFIAHLVVLNPTRVATFSDNMLAIQVHDSTTGKLVSIFKHDAPLLTLGTTTEGQIVTISHDNIIRVYDPETEQCLEEAPIETVLTPRMTRARPELQKDEDLCAWDPDECYITERIIHQLKKFTLAHTAHMARRRLLLTSGSMHADSELCSTVPPAAIAAVEHTKKQVMLYAQGKEPKRITTYTPDRVRKIKLLSLQRLATADAHGNMHIWDTTTQQLVQTFNTESDSACHDIVMPHADTVVIASGCKLLIYTMTDKIKNQLISNAIEPLREML